MSGGFASETVAAIRVADAPGTYQSRSGELFSIRRCETLGELDSCVALQQQAWGYPDAELVPRNLYVLAQALGGHVIGAWDRRRALAGFAMAVAAHEPAEARSLAGRFWMRPMGNARRPDAPRGECEPPKAPSVYLHSHMLAVTPAYRDSGLGFALKLAQRDAALASGIGRMRWTFDPVVAKNAFFNLQRLGATTALYLENFYGQLQSALAGGLPTDRLVAEWLLEGPRVQAAIEAGERRRNQVALAEADSLLPGETIVERIPLPAELAGWQTQEARGEAERAQAVLRLQLSSAFARGLRAVGFARDVSGSGAYLLAADGRETPG